MQACVNALEIFALQVWQLSNDLVSTHTKDFATLGMVRQASGRGWSEGTLCRNLQMQLTIRPIFAYVRTSEDYRRTIIR